MSDLKGKVALVTGASRGIGAGIAAALAGAGARVIATHRDSAADADAVVAALPGTGHRVIQASVVDSSALAATARSIAAEEGRLDVLINNAGVSRVVAPGDLDGLDDALIDEIFATNVRGAVACVRAFRHLLVADGGGTVINISSIAGQIARGSNIAYCASKAALNNLTMSLGRALAPEIRVIGVAPGLVNTEFTATWDPAIREAVIDATPLGALASVDDVARAVLSAVTELTHTTGVTIPVDGGMPLGTA